MELISEYVFQSLIRKILRITLLHKLMGRLKKVLQI